MTVSVADGTSCWPPAVDSIWLGGEKMRLVMPIGYEDFAEVRRDYYYVDKTGFLCDFLKAHAKVTLFTRPRRFGKTLMLSTLRYFLGIEHVEEHRALFDGLRVAGDAEVMAMQGTRPVVFLSLKGWKGDTWEILQGRVQRQLSELFQTYDFLLTADTDATVRAHFQDISSGKGAFDDRVDALAFLLRLLEAHYGKKPVLLLDEYDAPIQSAWEHQYYDDAIDFFREFLSSALKTNPALDFAVLTGVLRIAKENIFSALNNLEVDSVFRLGYPEAFGFTAADVEKIARDFHREDKLEELRDWYDGYRFARQEIYNPWSVVNYFYHDCLPETYWVNTSGNAILGEMLRRSPGRVLDKLEPLLTGGSISTRVREDVIYSEIYKNEYNLYTMLVTTGYLTTQRVENGELGKKAELVLPNKELRSIFRMEIIDRYQSDTMDIELEDLMQAFITGDIETVRDGLAQYLLVLTSSFDTAKGHESFYHGFTLGMTATLLDRFHIRSNHESGYGRYDIAAFPKHAGDAGMVIECKAEETADALEAKAEEALAQIEEKDYLAEFRARGITAVHQYGIAFCGKKVRVAIRER